ncbi:MAG: transcription antitermination factor NusB [Thiolinea sp.]
MNSRAVAARALLRVIYQGESLTDVLQHASLLSLSPRDQSWVRNACFGCLRWHGRLSALLRKMLTKSLKKADKDIECLLRLGLYQLLYQRTPDHAAVNETVAAARSLKKAWAGNLINGVLRNFLRNQQALLAEIDGLETARYSFPDWLSQHIKQDWPQDWEAILTASNQQAAMTLRVNQRQTTVAAYQQSLTDAGLVAEPVAWGFSPATGAGGCRTGFARIFSRAGIGAGCSSPVGRTLAGVCSGTTGIGCLCCTGRQNLPFAGTMC